MIDKARLYARLARLNASLALKAVNKQKYFCVGRNKTGKTSIARAFSDLGYVVAHQPTAERLAHRYYFTGRKLPFITYALCGQVFQDVPFSWPGTFRYLADWYPNSKFILSVRDDSETWYRSITRFHAKLFGRNGRIPTAEDLENAGYVKRRFMANVMKIHGTPRDDPYNKDKMISAYERHNAEVKTFFQKEPERLLVVNVSKKADFSRFLEFIEARNECSTFPWENRT